MPYYKMDACIYSPMKQQYFQHLTWTADVGKCKLKTQTGVKTIFTSNRDPYRFVRMLFGLKPDPGMFQRAIDVILAGVKW